MSSTRVAGKVTDSVPSETKDDATAVDLEKQQHEADADHNVGSSHDSVDQAQDASKPPFDAWADPSTFPDGGAQAWLTVAAAAACYFVSWGWINCIGVFQDYFMRVPLREYSPSTVAWIPSCETFFMLITGPFAGYIFDNYGPRYVLLVGSFMHVFGLMMASISHEYYQFMLSQGVVSGIGASFIFTPAISCVSTYFYKKRGMVSRLIKEVGFGWAMRTCAFLILGLMIFANLALSSRFPPSKRPFSLMAFIRPMQELPVLLLLLATFFFFWGMFPVFSFITAVANGRGMSLQLSQYLVSVLNAGSIFGRTLPGIMGDRFGRFNVMTVFCFFTSTIILALWIPTSSNVGELIFAPLFGFGSGAAIGLSPALIAQISPIKEIGTRTGLVFGIASIGALTGSPIGGALITREHGKFTYMQVFGGVVCFAGASFFLLARIKIGGWSYKIKV